MFDLLLFVALLVGGLWLFFWLFLNGMNDLHHPGVGFRYDWLFRQYIKRPNGEREYF